MVRSTAETAASPPAKTAQTQSRSAASQQSPPHAPPRSPKYRSHSSETWPHPPPSPSSSERVQTPTTPLPPRTRSPPHRPIGLNPIRPASLQPKAPKRKHQRRNHPEYAAGHIAGSQLVPLSTLARVSAAWDPATPITLVCRTDRRANLARQQLAACNFTNLTILEGGIEAWRSAGKPLEKEARQPWSLERQVRVVAGSLFLITLLLAHFVSAYFFLATAFVGAGLVFAGVSDICMMATILGKLPWNRA